MYYHGKGVKQDYQEAYKLFTAGENTSISQFYLGEMYYYGKVVKQNYFTALGWYEKAAKQGYVLAQYNLGSMYLNGQGVRQDKALAKEYFGQACDNKYQKGCDMYKQLN